MKTLLQDRPRAPRLFMRFIAFSMAALVLISGCSFLRKRQPYQDPDRLVSVVKVAPAEEEPVWDTDFLTLRSQSMTLGPIAAYVCRGRSMIDRAEPERINTALVSADFFPALGVNPLLGRALIPEENRSDGNLVAVVSYNLWQRRFGGDPRLIGRKIKLDQAPYTVVGVMPPDFQFPIDCELWAPMALGLDDERLRPDDIDIGFGLEVFARLKPGVTLEQAQAEMNLISRKLESEYTERYKGRSVQLTALREKCSQEVRMLKMKIRRPAKPNESGKEK